MKLKTIAACMLALLLAVPAGDMYAQTRKKSAAKKTTTAAKSTAKKAVSTAKAISRDAVEDHWYYGYLMLGTEAFGNNVGFGSDIYFHKSGKVDWNTLGSELEGTWNLAGTALNVKSGGLDLNLTSPDGGKTLTGFFVNKSKGAKAKIVFDSANLRLDKESTLKALKDNAFTAHLNVYVGESIVVFPVDFKYTLNEEGDGGTYKILADNALGLGLIKGSFTLSDKGVTFTSNLRQDDYLTKYGYKNFYVDLGKKHIDGSGKCTVCLNLFVK